VLGPEDLYIGAELAIYGRVFRLVDADENTRGFYAQNNKALGTAEEYPLDPFTKKQSTKRTVHNKTMHPMKLYMEALKGKFVSQISSTQQFLQKDGKVLRFYCTWTDDKLYGEKRPYILHYYLADDTIELVEIQQPNSGRDAFPALLKRQKLPKNATSNNPDVSRIGMQGKDDSMVYYSDKDLKVGSAISIYTRELALIGCDKFTQDYYVKTYSANPDDYHDIIIEEEEEELPKIAPPPHNGMGSEEDSLNSFLYLMPKVPKQDFKKLMENDGINLRYLAKFVDPAVEDKDRRFILTYYLNNDTVSIFEKFERNSGFIGGKFFERNRIKNPKTGQYYKATDFYVGGTIIINKHTFEVIEGDQYTLNYMKQVYSGEEEVKEEEKKEQAPAPTKVATPKKVANSPKTITTSGTTALNLSSSARQSPKTKQERNF